MKEFEIKKTVKRGKEFFVEAPWPAGAPIGSVRRMMAAFEEELVEAFGPDRASFDDIAWVLPTENKITMWYERPGPDYAGDRCDTCGDLAEYLLADGKTRACADHAARRAAAGESITARE